ncbi:pyridoxal-dependent aspartate 1-decarboxylase PanP [Motiliproteus sp. MSK22-1]|uniref:pyridoxal-dependent aspartate 1-decarboxylase PanP n=1 Tax=Motiliproteus sp. MSK22-1 TaxID=1897630 RepID=UPI000976093B|nr:putative pyridoxal-dependent aspartate 1-decarboxylase [Motiliproteus sp. MSK22-1]OMH32868.1 glutamate decarboxylase [Motiliproteus sp. MSK22-1]
MSDSSKHARASMANLYRIFTIPEAPDSVLRKIDEGISENMIGFLQKHIVAEETDLVKIEKDFSSTLIPEEPKFVSEQTEFLMEKVVAQSVHTSSPSFIGHMTSALPYFMIPLSKIMIALNQNLVKTETSKVFTPLERQVLGMLHRLIYDQNEGFYERWLHDSHQHLGAFCSGGTVANITALWAARNKAFGPEGEFGGIAKEGVFSAYRHYGCEGAAILVSQRGHYSLSKSADLLGIGREQVIAIDTDQNNKIKLDSLRNKLVELKTRNIRPFALIGIAGTTETGNIDPLDALADIAESEGIHFHVDGAWGGPAVFSNTHRHMLKGIERADSVTIDAHKQLYVPMGVGLVLFRDPDTLTSIEHHAQYIIRRDSKDLGSNTLEGSRPGMAMLVHSALNIIGRGGYELLINQGIEKAQRFAEMICESEDFELVTEPELNILTYRWVPASVQKLFKNGTFQDQVNANEVLNKITRFIQKTQREHGLAFVSRTQLNPPLHNHQSITVFRVVLANPLTTVEVLRSVLDEQRQISNDSLLEKRIGELDDLVAHSYV